MTENHPRPENLVNFKGHEKINTTTSKSEKGRWGGVRTLCLKAPDTRASRSLNFLADRAQALKKEPHRKYEMPVS